MEQIRISMPPAAARIIHRLEAAGHEAYIVGGCVRDSLLGREPGDWDITTSARPQEVKALFRRTIDTGIRHGTVTVMDGREGFEVTTYRLDGVYEDGRHPVNVEFTRSLSEDLKRRDFTINAMAYNETAGLVDEFDGIGDIRRRIIRCVGSPKERFGEDALRMMRALRFCAQLGFEAEVQTLGAVKKLAHTLDKISRERIQAELNKLLVSAHPGYFRLMYETGLTKVFIPEFDRLMEVPQHNPYHCYSVGEHTLRAVEEAPEDLTLRLTMLLHDIAKGWTGSTDEKGCDHFYGHAVEGAAWAEEFLRRLKYDNDTIRKVSLLVKWHDVRFVPAKKSIRRLMHAMGPETFPSFLAVYRADTMAKSEFARERILPQLKAAEELAGEILAEGSCLSLKELAVKGSDLIAAGMKPGPELGQELDRLLNLVIEDPSRNTRDYLMKQLAEVGQDKTDRDEI
jgi:tRNA nucleotidyltransferase (CCA-adding enzyme)